MMSDFFIGQYFLLSSNSQTLLVSGGRGFIRWLKEQGRRDSVITRQAGELANLHSQVHERVGEVWALPEDVLQVCEAWRNKRIEVATGGWLGLSEIDSPLGNSGSSCKPLAMTCKQAKGVPRHHTHAQVEYVMIWRLLHVPLPIPVKSCRAKSTVQRDSIAGQYRSLQ